MQIPNLLATGSIALQVTLLVLALLGVGGCGGCDGEWKTVIVGRGNEACRVVVYSPPFDNKDARPPDIAVLWDGKEVFKGALPRDDSGLTGMPVHLLNIFCSPGDHFLEVRTKEGVMKVKVPLGEGQVHYYKIFGVKDGKETLIQDIGDSSRLI